MSYHKFYLGKFEGQNEADGDVNLLNSVVRSYRSLC